MGPADSGQVSGRPMRNAAMPGLHAREIVRVIDTPEAAYIHCRVCR
jgi:hypothetical protein